MPLRTRAWLLVAVLVSSPLLPSEAAVPDRGSTPIVVSGAPSSLATQAASVRVDRAPGSALATPLTMKERATQPAHRFGLAPMVRRYYQSFADYQFPDPGTGTNPLSRLEFPIDNWFAGLEATGTFGRCTLRASCLTRLEQRTGPPTKDSDWEDPTNPQLVTTYSETKNRVVEGRVVDVGADWKLAKVRRATLGPSLGYRWQTFRFIAGDGLQTSINPPGSVPLEGDTFDVRFTFRSVYLGTYASVPLGRTELLLRYDREWGRAVETDRHLLRGNRFTSDTGRTTGWHVAAGLAHRVSNHVSLRLEWDFRRVRADDANHFWNEADGTPPESWSGARVYSDQRSFTLSTIARF